MLLFAFFFNQKAAKLDLHTWTPYRWFLQFYCQYIEVSIHCSLVLWSLHLYLWTCFFFWKGIVNAGLKKVLSWCCSCWTSELEPKLLKSNQIVYLLRHITPRNTKVLVKTCTNSQRVQQARKTSELSCLSKRHTGISGFFYPCKWPIFIVLSLF